MLNFIVKWFLKLKVEFFIVIKYTILALLSIQFIGIKCIQNVQPSAVLISKTFSSSQINVLYPLNNNSVSSFPTSPA